MGTPEFAVPILGALHARHEVLAVVTQMDKPRGRGKRPSPTPVREFAESVGLRVLCPERIKNIENIENLRAYNAEVFVVAAYGQLLPPEILEMPKYGAINVHGSLLPKYRGAAPIERAILAGERETGVSIMQMDRGLDTGDVILAVKFPIEDDDNSVTVRDKMAKIGANALLEALSAIEAGAAVRSKQDDSLSSYAKMLTKEEAEIDWSRSSREIANAIRGYYPAFTRRKDGEILKLWASAPYPSPFGEAEAANTPGEILETLKNRGFVVKTGDGALLITEVQAAGGRRMSAAEYLRGNGKLW